MCSLQAGSVMIYLEKRCGSMCMYQMYPPHYVTCMYPPPQVLRFHLQKGSGCGSAGGDSGKKFGANYRAGRRAHCSTCAGLAAARMLPGGGGERRAMTASGSKTRRRGANTSSLPPSTPPPPSLRFSLPRAHIHPRRVREGRCSRGGWGGAGPGAGRSGRDFELW